MLLSYAVLPQAPLPLSSQLLCVVLFLWVQVPDDCNPVSWAWSRLLRVVTDTIALQINYCKWGVQAPISLAVIC